MERWSFGPSPQHSIIPISPHSISRITHHASRITLAMPDLATPPPLLPSAARLPQLASAPTPTFLAGLRGIWLFTWRPQLTWRKLPLLVLGLLAVPVLVYLTTPSPRNTAWLPPSLGNPAARVREFARLARRDSPLQPEQEAQLRQIFNEEFARAEISSADTQSAEASVARQREEIKACYDRIRPRAQTVLNGAQFERFKLFENMVVLRSRNQVRPTWNPSESFYHWLIDFYFFVILPLQCVKGCGGLIRDELQADTLGFLVTRPLSRARLLVLKYLTQTVWLQVVLLIETLLLFLAGGLRQIPALGALLPLFLAAQFLAVLAWSALGVFLGQVTKRYMALALLYGLIVELGIGRIPTNINSLSLMRHLKTLLSPNSTLRALYDWTNKGLPLSVGALAFATALFVALAALLFTFKEYHHTAEMQK